MEKIAPIPNLECKPNPAVLRHCSAKLTKRLSFGIDDTVVGDGKGLVYEIWSDLSLDGADDTETEMFDTLCTASVMAARPKIGASAAARRYSSALRKSANKSKTSNSETIVIGNPDTLITRADGFGLSCRISAEDDYRLQ